MIEGQNESKAPSTFVESKKYIGVASVSVLAINPNNAKLRKYGYDIPLDAEEREYLYLREKDGKIVKSTRISLLCQIHDLPDKPVVTLDFWVRPDIFINKDGSKCKVIDYYGQTAWGTKSEVKSGAIPQYASGPAKIKTPYRPCHFGESALITFVMKYDNLTPLQVYDKNLKVYVDTTNPGRFAFDNWAALADGDVTELAKYLSMFPNQKLKVILGVSTTSDNKSFQTFMMPDSISESGYISNGVSADTNTGSYSMAEKAIKRWHENNPDQTVEFSSMPVMEWVVSASEVHDNSESDLSAGVSLPSQEEMSALNPDNEDDLPF